MISNKTSNKNLTEKITINIFSNINISFIDDILINQLKVSFLKAKIFFFDLQSIAADNHIFNQNSVSIVFWEFFNILPKSIRNIKLMRNEDLEKITLQLIKEINFFINKVNNHKKIFFNLFNINYLKKKDLELYKKSQLIINQLNRFLVNLEKKNKNLSLINLDIDELKNHYDYKNFSKTKSVYNYDFICNYSKILAPKIASLYGKIKKVLILDCDNTLWHGILGENKINYSEHSKIGKFYFDAQKKFKILKKKGAIICLCSKNNYSDVNNIIKYNKKSLLRNSDITLKKINWQNKANNILEISKELNLDPSSFIFLDDSNFELKLVKKYLPSVMCLKVPELKKNYKDILFEIGCYFNLENANIKNKTLEYKNYLRAENFKKKFNNIDDYIQSLNIKIYHKLNSKPLVKRMSQMCMKTNQFNFTTKRYTESNLEKMIKNKQYDLHTFSIEDKFGNSGVTALMIIKKINKEIFIDHFLMSCRVLGRKIELTILKYIIDKYKKTHNKIFSKYIKSNKNLHIRNFFSNNHFKIIKKNLFFTEYMADLNSKKFLTLQSFSRIYETE